MRRLNLTHIQNGEHRLWCLHKQPARGFSFIEMATAIVVLGAVFILTLKGEALLENFRALMAVYQLESFQSKIVAYQSEFHTLPGDDMQAPAREGRAPALTVLEGVLVSLAGNERIDGKLAEVLNPNGEQFMAWRDLRYEKYIDGDPTVAGASARPENPFGGVYGFDEGNLGQQGGSLCMTRVPGRAAALIDRKLDDGVINKGRVVATSRYDLSVFNHFDAPDTEPYNPRKTYIICVPMLP